MSLSPMANKGSRLFASPVRLMAIRLSHAEGKTPLDSKAKFENLGSIQVAPCFDFGSEGRVNGLTRLLFERFELQRRVR